jgi:cellobiose-specific phosphotransferase system component IIC
MTPEFAEFGVRMWQTPLRHSADEKMSAVIFLSLAKTVFHQGMHGWASLLQPLANNLVSAASGYRQEGHNRFKCPWNLPFL